jgi:glyoxylase-like metal-dependent hydrolase (beta-lactamase superfamily II)
LLDSTLFRGEGESGDWVQMETAAPCLDEASQLAFWQDALWMGGGYGVGRLVPGEDRWLCYTPATGMLDQEFQRLVPTEDGLWFSHTWYGVWRYQEF